MKIKVLCFLMTLVLAVSIIPSVALTSYAEDTSALVERVLSSMSLRDKVTQMMMVDFRKWGATADEATSFTEMNADVRKILEDYNFGAVILFADNVKETEQTLTLTKELQAAAIKDDGIPMIITADQEGGTVSRLGSGTALPGNMALGATYALHGTKYAEAAGRIIGSEMSALGINTNLAPVVDVNNNANNPVIGLRSFGDDPNVVGTLASAIIKGMAEYNVIGTAKHFPGHGDTAKDSHYDLPTVGKSLNELKQNELKPYDIAISEGIEMIMTAHILYPQLESDKILSNKTGELESLPATMSDDILTGLLKGEMGFDGIVVTDAMNMAGITQKWDAVQAAVVAISAGVDMLCMPTRLYCNSDVEALDDIIEGILAAVNNGEIPMSRINDAVTRILTVKSNRGILDYDGSRYSLENAKAVVGCEENRNLEREMAAAAITLVKNENDVLPLKLTKDSNVLMLAAFSDESASMIMAWNRAKEAGIIPDGAKTDYFCLAKDVVSEGVFVPELQAKLDAADTIVILSECSSAARMAYNHWLTAIPNQLCDFAKENGKTSVIISADRPYDVQLYPNADAILAAYGWYGSKVDPDQALENGITTSELSYGPNIPAAVEVILGTYSPQGRLPLNVPVYDVDSKSYTSQIAYERGYGLSYPSPEPDNPTPPAEDNTSQGSQSDQQKDGASTGVIIGISAACAVVVCAAGVAAFKIHKKKKT